MEKETPVDVNTFGVVAAGAVLVLLNQRKSWDELSYELGLVEPDAILTDGDDYGFNDQLKAAYGDILRPMRVKSYRWQRDRMVAGTFWISVVARMKMTWAGGSSSVFSSALNAAVESMCTSSMI